MNPRPHAAPAAAALALALAAAVASATVLASCAGKPLDPAGEVSVWTTRDDPDLERAGSSLPGLAMAYAPRDKHWLALLGASAGSPDLVAVEWGRDVLESRKSGALADLESSGGRMGSLPFLWRGLRGAFDADASVYPAALYCWGIFYNPEVLRARGLSYPKSWKAFLDSLPELKKGGVLPIAVGGASGWPALAWVGYLELRTEGVEAYRGLVSGKRSLADKGLARIYASLQDWRDSGWIGAAGEQGTWTEALAAVEAGRAAYALMGAFAAGRFSVPGAVRWAPLPSSGAKGGEMAVAQGFALSAKAKSPEAALALADAYVRQGAAGMSGDAFRVAAIAVDPRKGEAADGSLAAIKASQEALLRSGAPLVPQLDRVLPPQAAYDANKALSDFLAEGSRLDAVWLAGAMARIAP